MRGTIKPLLGGTNIMGILSTLAQSGYDYGEYYTTTSSSSVDPAAAAAAAIVLFLFSFVLFAVLYIVFAIFLGKIFKKAGQPSWIAWVPIYNSWKLLEIGGQQGFWAILALIPVVNIVAAVFMYIAMYNIGLKLGKEGIFVLLAIFLPVVWLIWLAVDKSTWDDSKGAPSLAAPTVPPAAPTTTPPAAPIV